MSGTQDPYKNVDPNGLQTGSTAATAIGLGLVATSEGGTTIASALGLGTSSVKVLTAGFSLATLGHVSLFSAGLILIGLGIVLNVMSLVLRLQLARKYEEDEYQDDGGTSTRKRTPPDRPDEPPPPPLAQ